MSKSIFRFWTPIPPMNTGTATYFELILDRLVAAGLTADRVKIITDCAHLDSRIDTFRGCEVIDWRTVQPSGGNDLEIVSIANNEYHGFVFGAFADPDMFKSAKVISIIHEPCCFMLANTLSHQCQFGLDIRHLSRALESQYGDRGMTFLEDFKRGLVNREFDYASIGFIEPLLVSQTLIFHSLHAFLKSFAETSIDPLLFPKVKIASHPVPLHANIPVASDPGTYASAQRWVRGLRVGMFGRLTSAKRVFEALQGFAWYLDRVGGTPPAVNSKLLLVGSSLEGGEQAISDQIDRLGLGDQVVRMRDVDDSAFAELALGCDAVISMRYPSCGESSGGLAHARGGSAAVIASRFQSFADEWIDCPVPVPDGAAALGIANALLGLLDGTLRAKQSVASPPAPVDKVLMQLIAAHDVLPLSNEDKPNE